MYSPKKEILVKSLCRLSAALCSYTKQPCDCKFMREGDDVARGSENGSGCPEAMVAAELISHMTQQEFDAIAKRAGIIPDSDVVIDAVALKKHFQEELWKKEQEDAKLLIPIKRNRKSAYVPGKLPKGTL